MPGLAADLMLTDPPYGIAWRQKLGSKPGDVRSTGIVGDDDVSARDEALALWGDRPALLFGSFYRPFPPGTKQVLVYAKPKDAGLVGSYTGFRRDAEPIFLTGKWPKTPARRSCVIQATGGIGHTCRTAGHPHAKPVPMLRDLLRHSPAGAVLDPFMGSGSTLVACVEEGRAGYGIEIEERFAEIAARRVEAALAQGGLFEERRAA